MIRQKACFTLRTHLTFSCQIMEDIFYLRMKARMIQLPPSDRPHLFSGLQYRCEYYFMYRSWVHYLKSWQIWKEKGCGLMKTQKLEEECWSLTFELCRKMIVTEYWELHHFNDNSVKDRLIGKLITWKHLYKKQLKKIQARLCEQVNRTRERKISI